MILSNDAEKEEYIYESFSEIFKDQYNNEKEVCWLKKILLVKYMSVLMNLFRI